MTSTLKTNAIEPEGGTTNLVIGESGQNTVIGNNDIRANVLQDAGGNAIFTSDGSGAMSGVNSGFGSAMVLISTQTASNPASITFSSGITSTYGEYIFKFYNINPVSDKADFSFQVNATDSTSYDEPITSSCFRPYHYQNDSATDLAFFSGEQGNGTAEQFIIKDIGNGSDESASGEMHLWNPGSTTYMKHFYTNTNSYQGDNYALDLYTAGYINDTTAINDIRFRMASGNFDGTIKMFGVK